MCVCVCGGGGGGVREGVSIMNSIKAMKNNKTMHSDCNVHYQWCASS